MVFKFIESVKDNPVFLYYYLQSVDRSKSNRDCGNVDKWYLVYGGQSSAWKDNWG